MKLSVVSLFFFLLVIVSILYLYSRTDDTFEEAVFAYKNEDYKRALGLFLIAAEKGNSTAMVTIGEMYAMGKGVEKDNEMALKYFHKAKKNESIDMILSIAKTYKAANNTDHNNNEYKFWMLIYAQFKK